MSNETIQLSDNEQIAEGIKDEKLRGGLLMKQALKSLKEAAPKLAQAIDGAEAKLDELEGKGKKSKKIDALRELISEGRETLYHAQDVAGGIPLSQEESLDSFRTHTMAIGTIIAGNLTLLSLLAKSPVAGGVAVAVMTAVFGVVGLAKKFADFDNVFGTSGRAKMLTGELKDEIKSK